MPGKLRVANKTCSAIRDAEYPATVTQMRSFLGMCNVYRRLVPKFSRTSSSLYALTEKWSCFNLQPLSDKQRSAFELLKKALLEPRILRMSDPTRPFSVDTDACQYQIGAALFQEDEDGVHHPVGFWSRTLQKPQRNYSASERECLAVVWAVQILRPYLEGSHFTV